MPRIICKSEFLAAAHALLWDGGMTQLCICATSCSVLIEGLKRMASTQWLLCKMLVMKSSCELA